MEKDANYALVGLSTLILFLGAMIFVVWLARLSFTHDYDKYDVIFQGPINGVSQGGEVRFNGIKVGEVTKIELAKANPKDVVAHVRMSSDVPVRTDSFATIEPLGITGVSYIQIAAGATSNPLLKDVTPVGHVPLIHSKRSTLSDLLEGGGNVLARTIEALDRVNSVLSDQNIKSFSGTIRDTQAITAELRSRKALFSDAETALQHIDAAAVQITALSKSGQDLLDGDGKRTFKSVADAAEEARVTAKQLHAMVEKLEGPTGDFASNGLPQLTASVASLQSAADSLDRLAHEIEANPRGFVSKAPSVDKEVKP